MNCCPIQSAPCMLTCITPPFCSVILQHNGGGQERRSAGAGRNIHRSSLLQRGFAITDIGSDTGRGMTAAAPCIRGHCAAAFNDCPAVTRRCERSVSITMIARRQRAMTFTTKVSRTAVHRQSRGALMSGVACSTCLERPTMVLVCRLPEWPGTAVAATGRLVAPCSMLILLSTPSKRRRRRNWLCLRPGLIGAPTTTDDNKHNRTPS
jgi:hypothetical protein